MISNYSLWNTIRYIMCRSKINTQVHQEAYSQLREGVVLTGGVRSHVSSSTQRGPWMGPGFLLLVSASVRKGSVENMTHGAPRTCLAVSRHGVLSGLSWRHQNYVLYKHLHNTLWCHFYENYEGQFSESSHSPTKESPISTSASRFIDENTEAQEYYHQPADWGLKAGQPGLRFCVLNHLVALQSPVFDRRWFLAPSVFW